MIQAHFKLRNLTMTDQELIKRISEICDLPSRGFYRDKVTGLHNLTINPLSNTPEAKAFCWDLMIEYKIDFVNYEGDIYSAIKSNSEHQNRNPQRAVLLAVIEKEKNK